MNIVHILDVDGYYGSAAMAAALARAQQEKGIAAHIVCFRRPDGTEYEAERRLRSMGLNVHGWRTSRWPNPVSAKKLLRFLHPFDVDVIHSHGYKSNILLGMLCCRQRPIVVSTQHGYTAVENDPKLRLYYALDAIAMLRLDRVVAVSAATLAQLPASIQRAGAKVVCNGIGELSRADDAETQLSTGELAEARPLIGSIGRLAEEKNFALLIQAFSLLNVRYPLARLKIAGEGPLYDDLYKLVTDLNLLGSVEFTGYVENTDEFIRTLDVYVNCSTTEGMPISILEVYRAGCPMVASNIEANKEIVTSPQLGLLFQSGNATALCDALAKQITLTSQQKLGIVKHQRSVFAAKHSAAAMCDAYTDVYQALLDKRKSG